MNIFVPIESYYLDDPPHEWLEAKNTTCWMEYELCSQLMIWAQLVRIHANEYKYNEPEGGSELMVMQMYRGLQLSE
jgi:hypothetical protein